MTDGYWGYSTNNTDGDYHLWMIVQNAEREETHKETTSTVEANGEI